jgi:hypothetical protein
MPKQMGQVTIDHRASPGLPEDVARLFGYDPDLVKEGKVYEADTGTCHHCKSTVVFNQRRTRPRGHCNYCNHYVCDGCAYLMTLPDYVHTPFEKIIDDAFSDRILESTPPNLLLLKGA